MQHPAFSKPHLLECLPVLLTITFLLSGLVLLFFGGEALVRGGVSLAHRVGLSPFVIGLTVIGFGTSTPELLVSVQASLAGAPDISIGNVVGSNIANILLILGVSACITPMALKFVQLSRDLFIMIAAALIMLALGYYGMIDRFAGVAMLAMLAAYLLYIGKIAPRDDVAADNVVQSMKGWKEAVTIVGGLVALMLGADLLVDSSTTIARAFGISEAVIGLTIVAVGTSLPELATSVIAAFRRHADVAIGNVIGSNIFNILGILGVTALLKPVNITSQIANIDIPLMLTVSVALAVFAHLFTSLGRAAGAGFLVAYFAYLVYLF